MRNIKGRISSRLLAILLSIIMIFSILPVSVVAQAATESHPDVVTISVTDKNGQPIVDASVSFVIDSNANGNEYIKDTKQTDEFGVVEVISSELFVEEDLMLTAEITKEGYKANTTSITNVPITSKDQNFEVNMESTKIDDVIVSGKNLTYEKGKEQALVSITKKKDDIVTYSVDDNDEVIETIPTRENVGVYNITVTVKREGYEDLIQTVSTTIAKADITDVDISAKSGLKYNESSQQLVEMNKPFSDEDDIKWLVNGVDTNSREIPSADAIGKYTVELIVNRGESYNEYSKKVEVEIKSGIINLGNLKVKGVNKEYTIDSEGNPVAQNAVEVIDKEGNFSLKYQINSNDVPDESAWQDAIPTVTNAGQYRVWVKAVKEHYEDSDVTVQKAEQAVEPFNAYIGKAKQKLVFNSPLESNAVELSDNSSENVYDFSVSGGSKDTGDVTYSIGVASNAYPNVQNIAKIEANGQLTVYSAGVVKIIATKPGNNNYETAKLEYVLYITNNDNVISFENSVISYELGTNGGIVSNQNANIHENDPGQIKYSLPKDVLEFLSINEKTGEVNVTNYSLLAEKMSGDNKLDVIVTAEKSKSEETNPDIPENDKNISIYFTDANEWNNVYVHYWYSDGNNNGWPGQTMTYVEENGYNQSIYTCEIPADVTGVLFSNGINQNQGGKQTVDIREDGKDIRIENNAWYYPISDKTASISEIKQIKWEETNPDQNEDNDKNSSVEIYPYGSTSYIVSISFATIPDNAYTLDGSLVGDNWFNSKVTVTPLEGFMISKSAEPNSFTNSVVFEDQGQRDRYIYLKNSNDGITGKILLEEVKKIDTVAPSNMRIEIEDIEYVEKNGVNFGFYNPSVTVKFIVSDETGADESGLKNITWYYYKDKNATSSICADKSGIIDEIPAPVNGEYVITKTFVGKEAAEIISLEKEEYRGYFGFTATDNAHITSALVKKDDAIVVVDTISPTMSAEFELVDSVNGKYNPIVIDGITQHYYDGEVKFTFAVKEANFFSEDVKVYLTKNGVKSTQLQKVDWTTDKNDDELHYGTFTISGDGDYIVSMSYKDQSGNVMTKNDTKISEYKSEIITIDETPAELTCTTSNKDNQTTTFTVTEHNFRPEDVTVSGTVKNINDVDVSFTAEDLTEIINAAEWKKNGDTYTFTYDYKNADKYYDGIYDLELSYKDISGNPANKFDVGRFTIDHTVPTTPTIEYSDSIEVVDAIFELLTLGFYNPNVNITFTAYDVTSGVDYFTWSYLKQEGSSNVNVDTNDYEYTSQTVKAIQDKTDKSKFTATITLPKNELDQLNGYISVSAKDNFSNNSETISDSGNVIVVDTISPKMKVEYSQASRIVNSTSYYGIDKNGKFDIIFTVEEANFFSEDVHVYLTKNDVKTEISTQVKWNDESVDKHIGKYTVSGDGHYKVSVEYKDKSNNIMTDTDNNVLNTYVSDTLVIDTVRPEISVDYQNTNIINTYKIDGNFTNQFYNDTQVGVLTIKELNFDETEVDFTKIISKDVTGTAIGNDSISFSEWQHEGEIHTIKITYNGDANYMFDVDYTDLATNKAEDYVENHFTVDKTAPKNLTVSYSTSVLETVLETITFGFYNAKMTVTITAEDDTSGIHDFVYSYMKSKGVSSVNAELLEQVIEGADIVYSEDHKTATAKFEIPKYALKNDNQFNGTVKFVAADYSKNDSELNDTKRIVVDNIAPTCTVTYNQHVNTSGNVNYFNGNIDVTVKINEANFYSNDVNIAVTKDGAAYSVTPTWRSQNVDEHYATFTLTADGDYIVSVNYTDKSNNKMVEYRSNQMTIDTEINKPTYSINGVPKDGEGGAYKKDATVSFNYEDQNFDTKTITLTRTRFNSVEDVTSKFVNAVDNAKGGSGSFSIPNKVENDGIYLLKIRMTDKANHSIESEVKFTINRYGSVYEYNDYLVSLIKDGGQYITVKDGESSAITEDLVITEYNANQIVEDSLSILITRDGKPIEVKKTTNPATINNKVKVQENGWYKYVYTISKDNFAEDGVYKITLTSKYDATDSPSNSSTSVPENSIDVNGDQILDNMNFTVDTTAPEIRNIINLDKAIVNAEKLNVKYTIVDVGGLKSVEVIVNGEKVDTITEFGESSFNYTGAFTINENSDAQTVQIVVTDLAGNVTDTASETFSSGDLYVFNDSITVSTNLFVRWYANKLIFWGSIAGFVVLAGIIAIVIVTKRKKKEDELK